MKPAKGTTSSSRRTTSIARHGKEKKANARGSLTNRLLRAHAHHSKRGPAWCLVAFTSSLQEESGFRVVDITPWSVHSITY